MSNHLAVLMELNRITQDLDGVQGWIDFARNASPTNQIVQLEMDRKQTQIDLRRMEVEIALIFNASLN
jgi:hypothetical protein